MVCSKCKQDLPEEKFAIDKQRKSGRSYRCKGCQKKLSKSHYEKNKDSYRQSNNRRMQKLWDWLFSYKSTLKCERCGFSHPVALDFHHRNGEEKTDTIAQLLADTKNKEKVLEEIAKCDVLCANCHRITHWDEKHKHWAVAEVVDA